MKIAYLNEPSLLSNSEVKLLHGSEIHKQKLLFSMLLIPVRPILVTRSFPDANWLSKNIAPFLVTPLTVAFRIMDLDVQVLSACQDISSRWNS